MGGSELIVSSTSALALSSDQILCPTTHLLTLVQLSTSLLFLSDSSHGIFSRVTMTSMTGAWYHRISPFETILVGLVVLQVFVMRYFLILPLNLSKLFSSGEFYGRKKRQISKVISEEGQLSEVLFTALRRIDDQDCLLRSICELEWTRNNNISYKLPKGIKMAITFLQRSNQRRKIRHEISNNQTLEERSVVSVFEEAVEVGGNSISHKKSNVNNNNCSTTSCQNRYSLCPLSTDDIMLYIETIELYNF